MLGNRLNPKTRTKLVRLSDRARYAIRRLNGTALYVPDDYRGAFVDSTGTQPVTAVNDLVGLLTDRSYGASNLGAELVTNGDFSSGTTGWSGTGGASIAVTSGELVVTNTTNGGTEQALQDIFPQVAAGKTYVVSLSARKGTAVTGYQIGFEGSVTSYYFSGGLSNTAAETKSFVFTFTSGQTVAMIKLRVLGLGTAIFDNISVKEVLGNHASQGTTASKPLVTQLANGRKALDFDGSNDSFNMAGPLWSGTEDHCVVVGITPDATGGSNRTVFSQHDNSLSTTSFVPLLGLDGASGRPRVLWRNTAGTDFSTLGAASVVGVPTVLSGRRVGSTGRFRVDGATIADLTLSGTFNTTETGFGFTRWNNVVTDSFDGRVSAVVLIKGTVSDADLATIERWVAQQTGVTYVG